MKKKVIVIGAGIGGLAAANLLARDGHDVHVFEKLPGPGGRAGLRIQDGFRFDTGPSWYLMPEVFERYYDLLGLRVSDELDLVKLSPAYKVFFEHEPPITITGDIDTDSVTFESIEPGAGHQLRRYVERGRQIYRLSLKYFLYTDFRSLKTLSTLSLGRHAVSMLRLASMTLHRYVASFVRDQRLQQILEYPMVFLGTSPFKAPAIYSLMSALDFNEGVYYPRGGIYTLIENLAGYGSAHGVTYHYSSNVAAITFSDGVATGIRLDDGTLVTADIIVSDADLHHTETKLLDEAARSYSESYWSKRDSGPTALLLYLGVRGSLPQLEHHNLLFVDSWHENFEAIEKRRTIPDPASIYICRSSATDDSVAPEGHENVFVLIPLPSGDITSKSDMDALTKRYLKQIDRMTGIDLTKGVVTSARFVPSDFADTFNAWQSTMLGQAHTLRQSAFFRTKNKSKRLDNLYYVGANTLPGIGLPMCLIGAELTVGRIRSDL